MTEQIEKPRIRIQARSSAVPTHDSFQNFAARVGVGGGPFGGGGNNLLSQSTYGFNPVTRYRQLLEWAYRGSWLVRNGVNAIADDATREGIEITSDDDPDETEQMHKAIQDLRLMKSLNEGIRWGRLYGGALGVIMVDGQKFSEPLRPERIGPKSFRGVLAVDRWALTPAPVEIVEEYGPDYGKPAWYQAVGGFNLIPGGTKIHHTRVVRFEGDDLPYWQRVQEQGWGLSVLEPLWDRLIAFDSTSMGTAQLVYKAHLRTVYMKGYRSAVASGGAALAGIIGQLQMVRGFQSNEGLTVLDGDDKIQVDQYAFSGLSDIMIRFAEQVSGALQIPLTRLFSQSPAGLNATGESDLRNYYDGVKQYQEREIRPGLGLILTCLHWSVLARAPDDGFAFTFRPLWQLTSVEKADVAGKIVDAVGKACEIGMSQKTALEELRQQSRLTGVFTNISDAEIDAASDEPPNMNDEPAGDETGTLAPAEGEAGDPEGGVQPDDPANDDPHPGIRLTLRGEPAKLVAAE